MPGGEGQEAGGTNDGTSHGEQKNAGSVVEKLRIYDSQSDRIRHSRSDSHGAAELHHRSDGHGLLHGQRPRGHGRGE